mmetsp:Transcript_22805/g.63420  ORF Transcript_22805/g.63420 Transcript_22805/m.63420 type:complete len:283 (+) Transcript_22805:61-909(+)
MADENRFPRDESLGQGPLRFAPENERTISDQIAALNEKEKLCYDSLVAKWKEEYPDKPFSEDYVLRFARCSPGTEKFNEKSALKVMRRFDRRYLDLKATKLEAQLLSKTLFPIPGLTTKGGHDLFYMRPSRYFPKKTSTELIIDNLAYCMTTMVEKEKACTEGIGFLANMDDWKFENFSVDYCFQFMKMLQGRVPVRVRLFLIVNPPGWFGKIWAIMKPMLAKDFRQKVFMIKQEALSDHLMQDFEELLCDDIAVGKAKTDDIVSDFVKYRKFVEDKRSIGM